MTKGLKPYAILDTTPDEVRDESLLPAPGETRYVLILPDAYVELLSQGIVPEAVSRRCFAMLEWKRTNARNEARVFTRTGEAELIPDLQLPRRRTR